MSLAKELGCLFLECSARTRENVEQCFAELALKVDNYSKITCEVSESRKLILPPSLFRLMKR